MCNCFSGQVLFNRAMLMNVGYVEAKKREKYGCLVFHDVDLIPQVSDNYYGCSEDPRHVGVVSNKSFYGLPYDTYFGGAISLKPQHIEMMNGFSNIMFGWGGEDDDMYNR